jgi:hypothetical protein
MFAKDAKPMDPASTTIAPATARPCWVIWWAMWGSIGGLWGGGPPGHHANGPGR